LAGCDSTKLRSDNLAFGTSDFGVKTWHTFWHRGSGTSELKIGSFGLCPEAVELGHQSLKTNYNFALMQNSSHPEQGCQMV
jgi:hypothetical protein